MPSLVYFMLIETLPEVQALAPADKERLICELWDEIVKPVFNLPPDPRIFELLDRRLAEYHAVQASARLVAEEDIEHKFASLPAARKQPVLDRLVSHLGEGVTDQENWEAGLRAMASDPEVQAELRRIDAEFRVTESDGFGQL